MLKRVCIALLCLFAVVCTSVRAAAVTLTESTHSTDGGGAAIDNQEHDDLRTPQSKGVVEQHTTGSPSPTTTPAVVVQQTLEACYLQGGGIYPPSVNQNFVGPLPTCPFVATPAPGAPLNPGPNVSGFVTDYFRQIPVPQPHPVISAQNGGICGVLHSLNLNMQPEMLYKDPGTPFGDLTMHVYGTVTVNWGDGSSNTYTDGGADWPHSDIEHSWSRAGTYAITATVNWIAVYSVGPYQGQTFTGSLTGIVTTGAIPAFPVIQAQAVLIS